MLVASFPAGPLQANCYLVARGPGAGCAVVDPGQDALPGVRAAAAEHDLTPAAVLVTHGHFDHVWDARAVAEEFGCPVWVHPADRHLLSDPMAAISSESAAMLRAQLGLEEAPEFVEPADVRDAADGTRIDVDGLAFTVTHVPGHTPGTVVYTIDYPDREDVSALMFSGDFLFAGSIGRTDLTGGDAGQMVASLTTAVLPQRDDVVVLPGHGPQTSVGQERVTNPFLAELA